MPPADPTPPLTAEHNAVESVVRTVCPIENTEDDDEARYICLGEDGDPIIEAETLAEAVQSIIHCWNWCEGAWHKALDQTAALTAELAQRTAERDAFQRVIVEMAIPYEALRMDDDSRKWISPRVWRMIVEATEQGRAALAAPTEG